MLGNQILITGCKITISQIITEYQMQKSNSQGLKYFHAVKLFGGGERYTWAEKIQECWRTKFQELWKAQFALEEVTGFPVKGVGRALDGWGGGGRK